MTDEDKDNIIKKIYFSDDKGFGSINATYKEANKSLSSTTLNDVKLWFSNILAKILMWPSRFATYRN